MARFAAIDVGSNAMRLRIVEVERPANPSAALIFGQGREVLTLRLPVRLGREVFLTGALTAQAVSSAAEALRQFREAMDAAQVDQYRAVATSAVREAKNGALFVERARREAGIDVEVIEGVEEARLVQLAVRRRLGLDQKRAFLIDIGGGSTELTLLDRGETRASQSLPMGAVRLLEAFLEIDRAVDARHSRLMAEYVERVLVELRPELAKSDPQVLVATGGNMETLAALCPHPSAEAPAIDLAAARELVARMTKMSTAERAAAYGLRTDRADTIVPAAHILLRVVKPFGHATALAPGVGVKEGILEELAERFFSVWSTGGEELAITHACEQLGRRYQYDEKHGATVARLSTQLFDDLAPHHGLGRRERLLLCASAILHDVGDFVRYEGHHKHSWYLIEHSDIMGITPAERSIVANVARYHRKSFPDPSHPNFRDLSREQRSTVRTLASILRLADALDREHLGKVSSARAAVAGGRLRLTVEGEPDRELEEWTVARKAGLFRTVFDLDVEVVDAGAMSRPPGSSGGGRTPRPGATAGGEG
ncbi:MAG TPA: Ppx/GppA phosphatase family protein [Polyangiaceae bacterium]|nr:Ppx/GppA phosphatase family protein [Polyangiaceae bacterium]